MILFNGIAYANEMFKNISYYAQRYAKEHRTIKIASILFTEDAGSRLYAGVKQEQARQLGIDYELHTFSLHDPIEAVLKTITALNADATVIGIIIQKPWRKTWENAKNFELGIRNSELGIINYDKWWHTLYNEVDPNKDVDGLHPETIMAIQDGTWNEKGRVLPATCKAVLSILEEAEKTITINGKLIIIGKSDLVGIPLFHILQSQGKEVSLLGKKDVEKRVKSGQMLHDAQVIISATGVHNVITENIIADNVVLIDVGEPKPDIDQQQVKSKAAFLTPVPGGVGPVTVACLMQNAVYLAMRKYTSNDI